MDIFCYSRPFMHAGHRFSDEVALCMAPDMETAMLRFSDVFPDVTEHDVSKVDFTASVVRVVR